MGSSAPHTALARSNLGPQQPVTLRAKVCVRTAWMICRSHENNCAFRQQYGRDAVWVKHYMVNITTAMLHNIQCLHTNHLMTAPSTVRVELSVYPAQA